MQRQLLSSAIIGASLLFAGQAFAAGYYVDEQSALRLGDAFSGGSASASDASAAYYGPASMILVRDEVAINASVIAASSKFTGDATIAGQTTIGPNAKTSTTDVLPTLYFVKHLDKDFAVGAFVNAPYATGNEFGKDSKARYHATDGKITGIDAGVSLAFRINNKLSIGGSLIAQYLKAKTEIAIDTQLACLEAESPTICNGLLGLDPADLGKPTNDAYFKMEGDNLVMGYQLGALYEFSDNSRLGLNYRSKMEHSLTGTATLTAPANGVLDSTKADGRVDMTTPDMLDISYHHQLGALGLQATVQYSNWHRFQELKVNSNNPTIAELTKDADEFKWKESYRAAIGANYQLNEQLTVRTGLAYDSTPIPSSHVKADFAFTDYKAISLGATYNFTQDIALDAGVQHTFQQKRDINHESNGALLNGKMTTDVTSFALGLRMAI